MNKEQYNALPDDEKVIHLEGVCESLEKENADLKSKVEATKSHEAIITDLNKKLSASEKIASAVETPVTINGKACVVMHGVKLQGELYSKEDIAADAKLAARLLDGKSTAIKVKD